MVYVPELERRQEEEKRKKREEAKKEKAELRRRRHEEQERLEAEKIAEEDGQSADGEKGEGTSTLSPFVGQGVSRWNPTTLTTCTTRHL